MSERESRQVCGNLPWKEGLQWDWWRRAVSQQSGSADVVRYISLIRHPRGESIGEISRPSGGLSIVSGKCLCEIRSSKCWACEGLPIVDETWSHSSWGKA